MNKLIEELKSCVSAVDTNYRIGMRVVKTAAAVSICLFIAWLLGSGNIMQISAISALVTLRSTREDTMHTGVSRVLGTMIGGIMGFLTVLAGIFVPYYTEGFFVLVIPAMLVLNLYICNLFKMRDSCSISCVVLIAVAAPITQVAPMSYTLIFALLRVRDTLIGVAVATIIDLAPDYFRRKKPRDM